MIKAIDEYLFLEKFHENKGKLAEKRAELKMLHKVIADKKIEASARSKK